MGLANKNILVGITGSIAAYKSADLVRRLRDAGASVRVAMSENAKRFITPLTMQAVSGNPVHDDLFDLQAEAAMGHIELARWADLVLIAPATADLMARLVNGNADDLLTTLCLATRAPIAIAPAMNQAMWQHMSTQNNLQALIRKNVFVFGPGEGSQACGDIGFGRMLEPAEIVQHTAKLFSTNTLSGQKILITAGPTHEAIDPVRYITNGSTGKMGYALAQAAVEAGANVTLVSGPVQLPVPAHVNCIRVVTALEMHDAVMRNINEYDMVFAVAAVSDYRCEKIAEHKIHKDKEISELKMVRNPDIAASIGALTTKPFLVGFAAETENVLASAKAKRVRKNMNMIIANQVGDGMGTDDNKVVVISENNETVLQDSKQKLARKLIGIIAENYNAKQKEIV
jgi:phosphopantothenoylcysteine decarboxylase/phosphopantothenate--cysteine ligase